MKSGNNYLHRERRESERAMNGEMRLSAVHA